VIRNSGLKLKPEFEAFDAEKQFGITTPPDAEPEGCLCGEVLKGVRIPTECKLFGKACTPENPVGACMVSGEGACQAFFRYG